MRTRAPRGKNPNKTNKTKIVKQNKNVTARSRVKVPDDTLLKPSASVSPEIKSSGHFSESLATLYLTLTLYLSMNVTVNKLRVVGHGANIVISGP